MSWLVGNTLVAGLLALIVLVVERSFRPRPALAHAMWLTVLAALALPPMARWSLPVALPIELPVRDVVPAPVEFAPSVPRAIVPQVSTAPLRGTAPRTAAATVDIADLLRTVAVWMFACGSLLLLVATLRASRRIAWRARAGRAPAPEFATRAAGVAARLGIPCPRIRIVAGIDTPFVWSLGRPTLLWPEGGTIDPARDTSLLAHEFAHLKRGDHWVARAEVLLALLFWWHPLFWFARARMRDHAELACDAWAVWNAPAARHAYARALVDALENRSRVDVGLPALGARPRARRAFEKRLMMILHDDVPRRLTPRTLLPLAALLFTAFSGLPTAQEPTRTEPTEARRQERAEIRQMLDRLARQLEQLEARLDEAAPPTPPADRDPIEAPRPRRAQRAAAPLGGVLQGMIGQTLRAALDEARAEIRADEDLQRLGLTKDVEGLLDAIGDGGLDGDAFAKQLGTLTQHAIRAGLDEARTEIRADEDLQRLGLTKDVEGLLDAIGRGDLGGDAMAQSIGALTQRALRAGLDEARAEIRADADLQELGLTKEIEGLLDAVGRSAGDGDAPQRAREEPAPKRADAIREAVRRAVREATGDLDGGVDADAIHREVEQAIREAVDASRGDRPAAEPRRTRRGTR